MTRVDDLDAYEAKVHTAIENLIALLEDPALYYPKQRAVIVEAIGWLEMDVTCGDCIEGRCHGAPQEECGCRHHEASVEAAVRRAAIKAWVINGAAPLSLEGAEA